ncbi:MAG: hypothetical protein KIY12_01905 [Thermoplasmata archaeon]|uniref:Uncharacterized protein n=1 Tax=Candidatus Sysuiplasma superficiale TaxID=2823368 RepID=A0A8J7YJC4_9ARCH|nr:hypothetical protein [Candidatus Sysuiplasma superficiale]MBX8643472.1 hypothetical protein [Candidatus Sysuiplasma superficiale]
MRGRKRKETISRIYREIVFHGYTASGITGISVKNATRAIAGISVYKYILTVFVAVAMSLLVVYAAVGGSYQLSIFPISVFVWTMLISLVTAMQLSYGASGSGNIRNFLYTVPLTEEEALSLASSAMLRTIDLPIFSSALVIFLSITVLGIYGMLSGIIALLTGFSIFLIAAGSAARMFRRLRIHGGKGLLVRLIASLPVIFFLAVPTLLFRFEIPISAAEMTYVPVLSLSGIAHGNGVSIAVSSIFALLLLAGGKRIFSRYALQLISPDELAGSRSGKLRMKIRTPVRSLIITDLRQAFRSPRLASLLFVPFVLVAVVAFYFTSFSGRLSVPFPVLYAEDILPVAFVSSYIAYLLYMTELGGLAYFKLLSISRYLNLTAKMIVSVLFYAVSALLLTLIFVMTGKTVYYIAAVYTLLLPLLVSVIFTSVFFQNASRDGRLGMSNPSSYALYTAVNLLIFAVPAGSFLAGLLVYRSILIAGVSIASASLVEGLLMLFLLSVSSD